VPCGTVAAVAGTQSRYEWQFKQRLTSGGLNSQTSYLARNTSEALRLLTGTDSETLGQTGIFRGFVCAVVAGTMRVSIAPGLGQFFDATVSEPDSKAKWMELRAAKEVTVSAADGANPRWDVIEVQPASINGAAEIIDFFNPADNTFTPAVVSVFKISEAAAQVRAGTAGANPKLPAGTAGWVPLAYVYVGAAVVLLNADRVMHCRPILHTRDGVYRGEDPTGVLSPFAENLGIAGGGWAFAADGYSGTLATSMSGRFAQGGLPFYLPSGTGIVLATAGNYEGGGLPAGNTLVHAYVAPPPYPSGYDSTMAPREMYLHDSTTPGASPTIAAGARNCIVLISSSTPDQASPLGMRGGPNANTGTFTDNLWGAFTRQRSTLYYIGAAYHVIAIPGMVAQTVFGATVATSRKVGANPFADLPIAAPELYGMWSNAVGDPTIQWPETALDIDMQIRAVIDAGSELVIEVEDYFGLGGTNAGVLDAVYCNTSAGSARCGDVVPVHLTPSGSITINYATTTGASSLRFFGKCYRDEILKKR